MSSSQGSPAFLGDSNLNDLVYLGFGLIGFGLVFCLFIILADKSKPDDESEVE